MAPVTNMPTVYLGLGSNLGDREANLRAAIERLDGRGVRISAVSRVYETEPVGETPEPVPPYLNCVVKAETDLPPEALLDSAQAVERAGGRQPSFRWGPRAIDVDILLYDGLACRSDRLEIPHPRLFQRAFALLPLSELAPDLRFQDGTTIEERLLDSVVRSQGIRIWQPDTLGIEGARTQSPSPES